MLRGVPRLWDETIDSHRKAVRDATLDAAATLVAERGVRAVTMSQIAERTGIGRATLYKYFPDVESILLAWHERQIAAHLEHLTQLRDRAEGPAERLKTVLEAYALIHYELAVHHRHGGGGSHGADIAALLHRGEHVAEARQRLNTFMRDLLSEAATAGVVRGDVAPAELTTYCLQALTAAETASSKAAVRRLVDLTLAGLGARSDSP